MESVRTISASRSSNVIAACAPVLLLKYPYTTRSGPGSLESDIISGVLSSNPCTAITERSRPRVLPTTTGCAGRPPTIRLSIPISCTTCAQVTRKDVVLSLATRKAVPRSLDVVLLFPVTGKTAFVGSTLVSDRSYIRTIAGLNTPDADNFGPHAARPVSSPACAVVRRGLARWSALLPAAAPRRSAAGRCRSRCRRRRR